MESLLGCKFFVLNDGLGCARCNHTLKRFLPEIRCWAIWP